MPDFPPFFSASSLLSEIHTSVRSKKKPSALGKMADSSASEGLSEDSESETPRRRNRPFSSAFDTYRFVTANKMMPARGGANESPVPKYPPGQGSSLDNKAAADEEGLFTFESYTVSRAKYPKPGAVRAGLQRRANAKRQFVTRQ